MKIKNIPYFFNHQHLILVCFVLVFGSCNESDRHKRKSKSITNIFEAAKLNEEQLVSELQSIVQDSCMFLDQDTIRIEKEVKDIYRLNQFNPLWLQESGVGENSYSLLQAIQQLKQQGMNPEKYHYSFLQEQLHALEKQSNIDVKQAKNFELAMSNAFVRSAKDLLLGMFNDTLFYDDWFSKNDSALNIQEALDKVLTDSVSSFYAGLEPKHELYQLLKRNLAQLEQSPESYFSAEGFANLKDSIAPGFKSPELLALRKRLFHEIGVPADTSSDTMDEALQESIKRFQYAYDLRMNGKLDTSTIRRLGLSKKERIKTIKVNMERFRWLKKDFSEKFIWVNIPKMELNYVDHDSFIYNMRVVVGKTSRPTPCLDADMTNVVINPNWSVPPTIMKEEIIPGIGRRGGAYLSRRGLTAYLGSKRIDPRMINAANFKRFRIEQKPGLNSALGTVKFNLPNPHAIYLHDTPHREDFKKYYRAYSSGCIRVEKPRDFAEFVLQDTNYSRPKIDTLIRKRTTKQVQLKEKIPVHIVYLTNHIDSAGNLLYLRDIYKKDEAMKALF